MNAVLLFACHRSHFQCAWLIAVVLILIHSPQGHAQQTDAKLYNRGVGQNDWPQMGGAPGRNNVVNGAEIPTEWDVAKGTNIKWSVPLGSESYGSVVVANGRVYVGTNNGNSYLPQYPRTVDLGVLLCFRESDGKFLWQYSSEKLPTGRIHDYPHQGICSSPVVEGDLLWFVSNRGEVVCLNTIGSSDDEDNGPKKSVWSFDMMQELGVSQHNMATCSPTIRGDVLFICTSNGVDEGHVNIPAPEAPSFIAMDKHTGKVLWTDNSPGENILHGQWSSPTVGVFDGVPQVMFGGGDGWLYSFRADHWEDGKPILLWKFDGNPKDAKFRLGGRATRNSFVAGPIVCDGLVYFAMGEDPEHGEGPGVLWCIDPTKRGDISAELVVNENIVVNSNSAAIWRYRSHDSNHNGAIEFEETMHRAVGSPTISNGLLFITDFSGLVHCLDAKTGKLHWTHDMFASCWTTSLIANDHVYVADEDGDVAVFSLSPDVEISVNPETNFLPLHEMDMECSVYTMPVVANGVLYIATRNRLFAIAHESWND